MSRNAPKKDGRTGYVCGPPSEVKGGVISHEAVYRNPTAPISTATKAAFRRSARSRGGTAGSDNRDEETSNKMYWSPIGVFLTALITLGIAIVQQMNS